MRYEGILKYLRKFTNLLNLLEFYFFGLGGGGVRTQNRKFGLGEA